MREGILTYRAGNDLEFHGPVNVREPTPVAFETIVGGATVTGRLYNTANDTFHVDLVGLLTAAVDAAGTVMPLSDEDALAFGVGDTVHVVQDTGLVKITTIASLDPLTLTSGLDSVASKNSVIRRTSMATTGKYLAVDSVKDWRIALQLIMIRDDFSRQMVTVDQVIKQGNGYRCNLIRVNTPPSFPTSSGREIKNQVGASLVMEDFGTFPESDPIVGDPEWGYRGPILEDHTELEIGMHIRGEIVATDSDGVVARRNEFATVQVKHG